MLIGEREGTIFEMQKVSVGEWQEVRQEKGQLKNFIVDIIIRSFGQGNGIIRIMF